MSVFSDRLFVSSNDGGGGGGHPGLTGSEGADNSGVGAKAR